MNFQPFTFIIERLTDAMIYEIKFLSTDKKKLLESLQEQLEMAQSFVRDIEEEKQQSTISHVLETKVQHIMKILPKIEDFLDTLYQEEEEEEEQIHQRLNQRRSYFTEFMACFSCTSNPIVRRHVLIDKAEQFIEDLQAIHKRAEPFQRQSGLPQVTRRPRPPTQPHIMNDEYIVGLEKDVQTLVSKLVGKEGGHTTVLAIAGMGGSGKTTLARKLYNDREIAGHFSSCRAWVCVSQVWDTPQLLREVCEQVGISLPENKTSVPYVELQKFLHNNSCLVVLDDVWKKEALEELLPRLLMEGRSRVLVTTRKEEIVNYATLSGVYIHKARCLTPSESWNLFSKVVRRMWQDIRSFEDESEIAQLGKEMLERCHGLPLAIIALAGLLCTKSTIQEWEIMKNNVISRILRQNKGFLDYGPVKEMLELSYYDLPYDLKPCFLYLGIFAEDQVIYVQDLSELWIAEGFVRANQCSDCETLEDVAMGFLDELVQRCMIQVVTRDFEEKVWSIRIHDLIRDLCIDKSKELNFFKISSPLSPSTSMEPVAPRVIVFGREPFSSYNPRLRSLIHFVHLTNVQLVYEKMKLIRVLHLQNVTSGESIDQVGNMILLRYLRIENCEGIKQLPSSIKKLRNLLTFRFGGVLDAKEGIPNNMVAGMEQLRHFTLRVDKSTPLLGVKKSKNLQILKVPAGEWVANELQAVSINALRIFTLEDIYNQAQLDAVYDFVGNACSHLHRLNLHLEGNSGLEFDLAKLKLERCRHMKLLRLGGKIKTQHDQHFLFPPNLLLLDLDGTLIEEEENLKRGLAQLGQLRRLFLYQGYMVDKLTMVGLPQLQVLFLANLSHLKEWRIEEASLPQLKELEIRHCNQLERLPERLGHIRTLQILRVVEMPESFCKRLRRPSEKEDSSEGGGGQDFHLIQPIPNIEILTALYGSI